MQVRNVAMMIFAPADKSRARGADDGMWFKEFRQLSLLHLPMSSLHLKLQKSMALWISINLIRENCATADF
jgi:hypothetical protein